MPTITLFLKFVILMRITGVNWPAWRFNATSFPSSGHGIVRLPKCRLSGHFGSYRIKTITLETFRIDINAHKLAFQDQASGGVIHRSRHSFRSFFFLRSRYVDVIDEHGVPEAYTGVKSLSHISICKFWNIVTRYITRAGHRPTKASTSRTREAERIYLSAGYSDARKTVKK